MEVHESALTVSVTYDDFTGIGNEVSIPEVPLAYLTPASVTILHETRVIIVPLAYLTPASVTILHETRVIIVPLAYLTPASASASI